ncbi:hypothetical protein FA95DRAFT_1535299 [Auriscalpium vulgare]|uniref:Uncharacterized protein n=1 Tax=Auriscalpium vulgare TaxID=40419 RepID=A0ACB8S3N0_9AGAM|nr:hypothetical protein FA95DRAFT_1535299 [Auriscalpium vulgare]
MKIVNTYHPPSSVVASVKCHLTSRSDLHLVVAKTNALDVYSAQPHGLKLECTTEFRGRASAIKVLPNSGKDDLVLLTDHPKPKVIFLTYNVSSSGDASLSRTHVVDLYEEKTSARPSEFLHDVIVNPSGDILVANCYTGKLRVITLKGGKPSQDFDARLPELNVLSIEFAGSASNIYALAILHLDYNQNFQLISRDLNLSETELSRNPSLILPPTTLSLSLTDSVPRLISVPIIHGRADDSTRSDDFTGGLLVLGGKTIALYESSSKEWQEKYRGKQRRLANRKQDPDLTVSAAAKEKEQERESKKRKARATVQWPWHEVTAWCYADDSQTKILIGDAYGRLAMLSLDLLHTDGLVLIPLGEISAPTTLTYLTTQVLFVGSHFGDSQLVKIHTSPISNTNAPTLPIRDNVLTVEPNSLIINKKGKGKAALNVDPSDGRVLATKGNFLEVIDVWKNLAPILDAAWADTDNSGQPHIVTVSGGRNTGSLRVIRNGADFLEEAFIAGLESCTNMYPLRRRYGEECDSHILVTKGQRSLLFQLLNSTTISHVGSGAGFITNQPTLAAANISKKVRKPGSKTTYEDSPYVVQVTPTRVVLVEHDATLETHSSVTEWVPRSEGNTWAGREIVAAALNGSQIVLALERGRIAILTLDNPRQFSLFCYKDFSGEISALSCNALNPSKAFSNHVAVSFWTSNRVEILNIISGDSYLSPVCSITAPFLPRSLLFHNFGYDGSPKDSDYRPHILIGLGDGTLLSYSFKEDVLEDKRMFSLGRTPVCLSACFVEGKRTVFASGSRAAVLYWQRGSVVHSPGVTASSRLNAVHWPSSLLLSTPNGLVIGKAKDLDKMHINTVPFGLDCPKRVFHDPIQGAFGVSTVKTEPHRVGEPERSTSSFKLIDDTTFDVLGRFTAEGFEEITSVLCVPVSKADVTISCYVVGTMEYKPDEIEPVEGHLHIFTAEESSGPSQAGNRLRHMGTADVIGCPYGLTVVDGFVAAAVNSSVVVYKISLDHSEVMKKVAEWNHSYLVTSIASRGSRLFAGDAMSSISALDLVVDGSEVSLTTLARDYGPLWPLSIESWDRNSVIGANSDCNLFTFTVRPSERRTVLERDGDFHLDDVVNKFLPGSINSSDIKDDAELKPRMLFFTASGRIGVLTEAEDDDLSNQLTSLERNLRKRDNESGQQITETSHAEWRAPVGGRSKSDGDPTAFGFVDGDFLERFLDYNHPSSDTAAVLNVKNRDNEGLKQSYGEIRAVLETLQGLH